MRYNKTIYDMNFTLLFAVIRWSKDACNIDKSSWEEKHCRHEDHIRPWENDCGFP
jgi:hypothetical protein